MVLGLWERVCPVGGGGVEWPCWLREANLALHCWTGAGNALLPFVTLES